MSPHTRALYEAFMAAQEEDSAARNTLDGAWRESKGEEDGDEG